MARVNIYREIPVMAAVKPADLTKMVDYLLNNKELFLSKEDSDAIFKEKGMASTPLSKLYYAFIDNRAYDNFSLLAFKPRSSAHIPETITYRHISLDMNQIIDVDPSVVRRVLAAPELNKKIIVNVTQMVSSDGRYYHLRDQEKFQSSTVRDCLTRSFFNSDGKPNWLRSSIQITLAKTYALLLANNISRWFGLDSGTQDYLTLVFAAFFLYSCSDADSAEAILRTKHREFYVRERDIVNLCLDKFKDVLGYTIPKTLDECFSLIMSIGITRLFVVRQVLYSKLRTIGEDLPTTAIALEYPPYFTWACLNAISGAKNQLNIFLKKQNLVKELQRATGELIQAVPSLN